MAVHKVVPEEIKDLQSYEETRAAFRQHIIELKRQRRVAVGDRITFVFENHQTVLFQIQEMVRAERIVDPVRLREEIDVYNELIPEPGRLSATMLIEITESKQIRDELVRLIGIDTTVSLQVGQHVIAAEFEGGRSKEDKLSAVQYVRFTLDPAARQAFVDGTDPVRIVIDHPNYRHQAVVETLVRQSLAADLGDA